MHWIWLINEIWISKTWLIDSQILKLINAFVSLNWLISTNVNPKSMIYKKVATRVKSKETL